MRSCSSRTRPRILPLELGEALEAHVEDRAAWSLAEVEARHQAVAAALGVGGAADERDDLVEVLEGDERPSRMWARASALAQLGSAMRRVTTSFRCVEVVRAASP